MTIIMYQVFFHMHNQDLNFHAIICGNKSRETIWASKGKEGEPREVRVGMDVIRV